MRYHQSAEDMYLEAISPETLEHLNDLKNQTSFASGDFGRLLKVGNYALKMAYAKDIVTNNSSRFEEARRQITFENYLLSQLKHNHIVQFVMHEAAALITPHLSDVTVFLVMPHYSNGDLYHLLVQPSIPTWLTFQSVMLDISRGLNYLHSHDIIHRDIKAENILVDRNKGCVITDFGLSVIKKSSQTPSTNRLEPKGSLFTFPPELLINYQSGKYECAPTHDIYALSFVLYQMTIHIRSWGDGLPSIFHLNSSDDLMATIKSKQKRNFLKFKFGKQICHPLMETCLKYMAHPDPKLRPAADQLIAFFETIQTENDLFIDRPYIAFFKQLARCKTKSDVQLFLDNIEKQYSAVRVITPRSHMNYLKLKQLQVKTCCAIKILDIRTETWNGLLSFNMYLEEKNRFESLRRLTTENTETTYLSGTKLKQLTIQLIDNQLDKLAMLIHLHELKLNTLSTNKQGLLVSKRIHSERMSLAVNQQSMP